MKRNKLRLKNNLNSIVSFWIEFGYGFGSELFKEGWIRMQAGCGTLLYDNMNENIYYSARVPWLKDWPECSGESPPGIYKTYRTNMWARSLYSRDGPDIRIVYYSGIWPVQWEIIPGNIIHVRNVTSQTWGLDRISSGAFFC